MLFDEDDVCDVSQTLNSLSELLLSGGKSSKDINKLLASILFLL